MEMLKEFSVKKFPDTPAGPAGPATLAAWIPLLLAAFCLTAAAAGPAADTQPGVPDQKVRITADRLIVDTKTGSAEFIGKVKAIQGATVITSDRLKVLYDQGDEKAASGETEAAIRSIITTGNVIIHFDDKVATTDKAVYNSQAGIFTLTGKSTRVTTGDNTITGEKITVDRNNDRMTVEGGANSRVNAVIFAGQDGLAAPGASTSKTQ